MSSEEGPADYRDFMIPTGATDRDRGRQYRCPACKHVFWSTWGQARRHYLKEMKKRSDSQKRRRRK